MRFIVYITTLLAAAVASAQSTNHITIGALRHLSLPEVTFEARHQAENCVQVQGVSGGNIRFELLLPDAWNGRFTMGGGGGFVGSVQNGARSSVLHGYATVGTDTGHEGPSGFSARWAFTNLEAQVNFGYLAVHRTAEVAKAIIRDYYKADIKYSYFEGCSRGGGQAMMEAQRYPQDFDGIVAGAPAFDWTGFSATDVAIAQALYPDPGHMDKTSLDKPALQKLQQSILDQCDALDGLKDGIVQDPPSAHFDLAKVPGLTEEQRRAIAVIYAGASNGPQKIYPGFSPGAEVDPDQWMAWIVGPLPQLLTNEHAPNLMFAFGTQVFKYFVFNNPDWNYSTYNFSNFANDTRMAASFLDATNYSLDGLKAHKGKLILWHGWADTALPAQGTVDYYRQVLAHDANAADYCRLFMVPGCLHCGGGPGASDVDWLSVITDWVEHSNAPDKLIAAKTDHGKKLMTRPLYKYPGTAIYKGSGDSNSADSFILKPPTAAAQ